MVTITFTKTLNKRDCQVTINTDYHIPDDEYVPIDVLLTYINDKKPQHFIVEVNNETNIISLFKHSYFDCSGEDYKFYTLSERIPTTYDEANWLIWYMKNEHIAEPYTDRSNYVYDKKVIRFCSMVLSLNEDSVSVYSKYTGYEKVYQSTDYIKVMSDIKQQFSIVFDSIRSNSDVVTLGFVDDDTLYCTHDRVPVKLFTYNCKTNEVDSGVIKVKLEGDRRCSFIRDIVSIIAK